MLVRLRRKAGVRPKIFSMVKSQSRGELTATSEKSETRNTYTTLDTTRCSTSCATWSDFPNREPVHKWIMDKVTIAIHKQFDYPTSRSMPIRSMYRNRGKSEKDNTIWREHQVSQQLPHMQLYTNARSTPRTSQTLRAAYGAVCTTAHCQATTNDIIQAIEIA